MLMDRPVFRYSGLDFEAIYQAADGEHRVMVLLNMLSKQVKMTVSPTSIRNIS